MVDRNHLELREQLVEAREQLIAATAELAAARSKAEELERRMLAGRPLALFVDGVAYDRDALERILEDRRTQGMRILSLERQLRDVDTQLRNFAQSILNTAGLR